MKRLIVGLVVAMTCLGLVASAAFASSSIRLEVRKNTSGQCTKGMTQGTGTQSTAQFSKVSGGSAVKVTVTLVGAAPNTWYNGDLVQTPSGESCLQDPGEFMVYTNASGNGSASYSEPIQARTIHGGVFVMLFADAPNTGGIWASGTLGITAF
jgi:hypothetical protein